MSQDLMREPRLEQSMPHSVEAERGVLGGIILDNGLIADAINLLKPDDFYVPSHRRIYIAMIALFERGQEINPILIGEELKKDNTIESVGGVSSITNLVFGLPHSTHINHYARIIRGKSLLRRLVKTAYKIAAEALEEEDEPEIILDSAEQQIFELNDERTKERGQFHATEPIATKILDGLADSEGKSVTGLATGFNEFDNKTSGLQPGDFMILAARPSVGKTAWAIMLSENVCEISPDAVVAIFSLEMSKESLTMRRLCAQSNIDAQRFRSGFLSPPEWKKIADSLGVLVNHRIFINDTPGITVLEMRASARVLRTKQKRLDLIIVDYLQLMSGSAKRTESRQQEVSQISRDLKTLAKELRIPLVALSQLSRAPEGRSDHRPVLSDLRESGALEQDADLVNFLYRDDMHMTNEERAISQRRNFVENILAKQRNGPTGTFDLRWTPSSMRFDNVYEE